MFYTAAAMASHPGREPVLHSMYPDREKRWTPIYDRTPKSETLELVNFSFVDNPVATMGALRKIAELESTCTEARLDFNDGLCLDIGPFLVLQSMYRGMLPLFSGGRITDSVSRVVTMVGLSRALNMSISRVTKLASIYPLPFRTRSAQGVERGRFLRDQTSEVVTTDVLEYLNAVLRDVAEVELTRDGERLALGMVGEVLNNAERHSDPEFGDGTWSIAGFVARRRDGDSDGVVYRIHLALLSTGATIAESMRTAGPTTQEKMGSYVKRHRAFFPGGLTEENLQTVYALQDGVSRVEGALLGRRGGTGLMDVIDFFAELSGTEAPDRMRPRLAIISGSTCISILPPYVRGTRKADAGADPGILHPPRELWFNPSNSPDDRPDAAHVFRLPARLHGTLVTMAWTIDSDYLRKKAHETR